MIRAMMGKRKADRHTELLLHFDGDVKDYSIHNHRLTNNGCLFDASNAKFGSSVYRNSYTEKIAPEEDLLKMAVQNNGFTIDCWCYWIKNTNLYIITKCRSGDISGVDFMISREGYLMFGNNGDSSKFTVIKTDRDTMPERAWTHVAIVVDQTRSYLFINGQIVVSGLVSNRNLPNYNTYIMGRDWLGNDDSSPKNRLDELRISSIARWTSNFTPPTKPY